MQDDKLLPWGFNEDGNEIVDKNGDFIAYINGITGLTIESSNYIVKCVNSHDALIIALERLLKKCEHDKFLINEIMEARNALAMQ